MKNDTAEGGIISKEISSIFQGNRKIIDEDEEQDWAQYTAMGHSSLDGEKRCEDPIQSYMLNMGVEEVNDP